MEELLALLRGAGHADFRDARGPMGFTQRQAGGKFTRDEASRFIEALQNEGFEPGVTSSAVGSDQARVSVAERTMRCMPAGLLAAELERRGWTVTEPGQAS